MDSLLSSIYDSAATTTTTSITAGQFAATLVTALVLGLVIAITYMYNTRYTKSFVVTIALLPAIISIIIIMVNGSIGTGVAVAGAFSLVRFRSVPGTAREICTIFLTMATGLITGMGHIGLAAIFTVVLCLVFLVYNKIDMGQANNARKYKTLRVVVPEDLNYTNVFDDIFDEFTSKSVLTQVKTTNMGSMFKLTYDITLKDPDKEKEMIDSIRCRNGNLEVMCSAEGAATAEL